MSRPRKASEFDFAIVAVGLPGDLAGRGRDRNARGASSSHRAAPVGVGYNPGKKMPISRTADSAESEPCTRFWPISSA